MYKAPKLFFLKDQHGEGAQDGAASQHHGAQLPRNLPLPAPGEHPLHHTKDIEARDEVKRLEYDVPCRVRFRRVEEVEVTRAEDASVEDLSDERDALCRSIAVDGEDQDKFREDMGDVSQVAKDLSEVSKASDCTRGWLGRPTFHIVAAKLQGSQRQMRSSSRLNRYSHCFQ